MSEQVNQNSTIVAQEKSTHLVDVFNLPKMTKHSNADNLSVLVIPQTSFTYVARTEDWADKDGCLVAWVQPDSIIDIKRPEFSFLEKERVRARKIRGTVSYGLLIPLPDDCGLKPGDNAAEFLGVTHYDSETQVKTNKQTNKHGLVTGGDVAKAPPGIYPKYDVDSFLRYAKCVFQDGETVFCTEKLHGQNSKFVFKDGIMYCGSREQWKKEFTQPPKITLEELTKNIGDAAKAQEIYDKAINNFQPRKNLWWVLLEKTPSVKKFCEENPGWCIYGEHIGSIGGYPYGYSKGDFGFRAFDILVPPTNDKPGRWLNADEFIEICDKYQIPRVPLLAIMPYNFEKLLEMAEGITTLDSHLKEGVVVKPKVDRWSEKLGRVCLKIVSPKFLESN